MSRPLRVLYPGAVYHVTSRGNERRPIFRDADDCRRFLSDLELAIERYCWICHFFCLMGNHYHLVVETPRANLPIGMRHLNGCYTRAFNKRWGRNGHHLQGRYSAEVIEAEPYLVEVIRYVALNPMRTKRPLAPTPEAYPWSSYRIALGLAPKPDWLTHDWVLSRFGPDYETARAALKEFVDAGLAAGPPRAVGGLYVAGAEFIREKTSGLEPIPEVPRPHWQPLRPALEEVFMAADDPVALACRSYGYTMREIAEHLGCHYATVSRRLRKSERAA